VSWWIQGHIRSGVENLNFSEWNSYDDKKKQHKIQECIEMVEKNWMPIITYKLAHSEGRLSDAEREEMIAFFKSIRE